MDPEEDSQSEGYVEEIVSEALDDVTNYTIEQIS